jgi:uncharacterized integral membrane protein (TIGR00697 family)
MKKPIIYGIFVTSIIVANVVAGKIINIAGLILPAAVVAYAITFLMTDVVSEIWGKKDADRLVFIGFVCSIFASIMIFIAGLLPPAVFAVEQNEAFKIILGLNWKFVIASMLAYYASQSWDVWMFHKIKKHTGDSHKWIRNNLSTMTSQIIDTAIFITIAFWGEVPNIVDMIISQYVFKFILAALDTPFFYLLTKKSKKPSEL